MPRAREHFAINLVVLTTVEIATQLKELEGRPEGTLDLARLAANVGGGAIAGTLPDLLEPSLGNPNHRGFCHSLTAAVVIWWLVSGRHTADLPVAVRKFLLLAGVGYTSHLAADLTFSRAKGMGLVCARF